MSSWRVDGAEKDKQSITSDWKRTGLHLIDGVRIHEVGNVPKDNGYLVEIFRADWFAGRAGIAQVFQVLLNPLAISAWHAHHKTTDHLFVASGMAHIVLYDGREDSPTRGEINELRFGALRPALVVVPPRVWHGMQCISPEAACIINLVDRSYSYEDPDHWRVPADSPAIPFRF